MKFIIPVESIIHNKGGVILYDPIENKILKQYIHDKKWKRVGWRGGVIYNGVLITTDWNDLHYFDIEKWKYIKTFRYPTFNDLHYLTIEKEKLYVVNTGIDTIEIFNNPMKPKFDSFIAVDETNEFYRNRNINRNEKWNKKYKTRHSCHPNAVLARRGKIFVTCFENHTRGKRTGTILEANSGKIVLSNHNCHDGIIKKGDYYLTWTRFNKILIIKNFLKKKYPISKIDEKINIGGPGWWRGMIIHDEKIYVFSSYGYKNKQPARMSTIDLETKKSRIKRFPIVDNVIWDTVYQPILYEE